MSDLKEKKFLFIFEDNLELQLTLKKAFWEAT